MLEFATSATASAEMPSYDTASADTASARHPASARPYSTLEPVFPLLVAIADDDRAAAAIRMAAILARRRGAVPTVIRALGANQKVGRTTPSLESAVAKDLLSQEYRDESRASLQRLVADVAGEVLWRVETAQRPPLDAIVEQSRLIRAELIVMGLRHRGLLNRALSRDLLHAVVRSTQLPVLAVTPGLRELPRRIVVGIDFGEASIRAAAIARNLLAPDGEMHLIHVSPDFPDTTDEWLVPIHRRGTNWIRQELDHLIESLCPTSGMTLTSEVVDGDVTLSIEGCARRLNADLLAVGNDSPSRLDQFVSGTVSMALAHEARWSMLVVPARIDV